jgi:hypothetical protein
LSLTGLLGEKPNAFLDSLGLRTLWSFLCSAGSIYRLFVYSIYWKDCIRFLHCIPRFLILALCLLRFILQRLQTRNQRDA